MEEKFAAVIGAKSTEELMDIYTNPTSYQREFHSLAHTELSARNVDIGPLQAVIDEKNQIQEKELAEGRDGNAAYLIILSILALVGGIIAVIGGYIYAYSTRTSNLGNKYHVYNVVTRKWGRVTFWFGVSIIVVSILVKLNP